MKSLQAIGTVLGAMMIFSVSVYADRGGYGRGGHYPRHIQVSPHNHNANWVVPLMIGGALGYVLSEPRRETVTYVQTVQSPVSYRSQPMYQEQWVYFSDCDCQRRILVPVR